MIRERWSLQSIHQTKKKTKIIKNHNDHIRAKSDKKTHTHQTYRELKWK